MVGNMIHICILYIDLKYERHFDLLYVKSHSKSLVVLLLWYHTSNLITFSTVVFSSWSYFWGFRFVLFFVQNSQNSENADNNNVSL